METGGGASSAARPKRFIWALLVAGVVGLGVGLVAVRGSQPTVGPLVRDLESAGYVCEPMKKAGDGILSSFSACEKAGLRVEMSTQPTDQAHAEFVRFTIDGMGCSLAHSREHVGFTLYTRDRTVVYEFGVERRFLASVGSFAARDVECKKKTV